MTHSSRDIAAHRPNLLLVEDAVAVTKVLTDFLGNYFHVTGCADAASALLELGRQSTDVLLLDHFMPGGGTAAVARQAAMDGVPTVWMAGDLSTIVARAKGPHRLIAKPFGLDNLLGVLTEALGPACQSAASGA